ncbi:MAG: hypothetical protein WBV22_04735 [Anaerolineaceae bacterium]
MLDRVANLEKAPGSKNIHHWADYIEMLALQNTDKVVSEADVIDRICERQDLGEANDIQAEIASSDDSKGDKNDLFIGDCYRQLDYRVSAFGDAYPFCVSENHKVLQCKGKTNPLNRMYVFLLLAANLGNINKVFKNEITKFFEFISLEALRAYLPSNTRIINFGTHSEDGRYIGKLSKKIFNLAEDLRIGIHPGVIEGLDPHNVGDGGLDLVGYIPFNDNTDGILHIFCQCACTEGWISKQHDCSEQSWTNKFKFTAILPHMVFIPFCYRNATGSWYDSLQIKRSILVDRVRLIDLINNDQSIMVKFPDLPAVNQFLLENETIF